MFNKLLVAIDGSENTPGLIELSKELMKNSMVGSITLISVAAVPVLPLESTEFVVVDDSYQFSKIASAVLDKFKGLLEIEGITVNTAVVTGEPGIEISKFAKDNNFDAILMGSRGLSKVKGLLGSVSQKVLHTAPCPVWIYKS